MKIHPLTVCREKLQNNDFITTNYRKKAEMLEDIIAEEEELRNFAAEIYFEISNKILVRNSKRRKVLDCLKKLLLYMSLHRTRQKKQQILLVINLCALDVRTHLWMHHASEPLFHMP